jgi:hypothetical protein
MYSSDILSISTIEHIGNNDYGLTQKETAVEALDGIGEKSKDNVAEKDVEVNILNNTEDEIGQNSDMPN